MAVQLFPAGGVTWVVSLPTGLAAETLWPNVEWIEALAPVPGPPGGEPAETCPWEEVQAP